MINSEIINESGSKGLCGDKQYNIPSVIIAYIMRSF